MANSPNGVPPAWRKRLRLPAYLVKEAAVLAGVTPRTVSSWHYGYKLSEHKRAKPVFATERERGRPLSYLELVEVAFVGQFRGLGMPLRSIRVANDYLSKLWSVEYPFAQLKLRTEGYDILRDFEPAASYVAASRGGQLLWSELIDRRVREFDYEHGLALIWHPRGRDIPVIVDPRRSFGSPILEETGVATWIVRERREAGESAAEIADDFGMTEGHVNIALRFEGVEQLAA